MRIAPPFPTFRLTILAVGLLLLPFTGCASRSRRDAKTKIEAAAAPISSQIHFQIGAVSLVDEKKEFVLIDLGSNLYVPDPGTLLRVVREGVVIAQLKAAPEQKRPFIAGDIVEGKPKVGDRVER
jgi:hypothetical protein